MKIFILDTYYGDFLKDFYSKNKDVENLPYREHKQRLLDEQFGTADFFTKNFLKLGVEADEFIVNDEKLQKKWAKENGAKYRPARFQNIPKVRVLFKSNWFNKILEQQIFYYKPSIIFVKDISNADPKILARAKKHLRSKVAGLIASKMPQKETFEPYDVIVSSLLHYVEQFRDWGKRAEYLPLSFEPTVLPKLQKTPLPFDTTHIGGYGPIHNERNDILEKVAQKIKIDFWGYGTENLEPNSPILGNFHGQSWGLDMYNILFNSKITLTKHIAEVANGYANNMTLFEATGCGALLITDWKRNLGDLFELEKEVVTYKSPEDMIEKIRYFLAHPKEREEIAKAGQARTLKDHNYLARCKKLVEIFKTL